MSEQTGKKIGLTIGDDELRFNVSLSAYNNCLNSMTESNKVAPSFNFAMATVHPEDKEKLMVWLDQGLATDIAGHLMTEFRPKVQITVKA